jgi:Aminoglycoside-2''-adenylyltransferase
VHEQLAALARVSSQLDANGIDYWLFGGWAVDFYAGEVTRPHSDVDLTVWRDDLPRIVALLEEDGWRHAPEQDEDGGTGYERDGVRLELTYLVLDDDGRICIPLQRGLMPWPEGTFGDDVGELDGVRARLIGRHALKP